MSEQQQQKTELIQPGTQIDVPPPVKPKKREKMDVDALLKKLGQPGLYHLLVTLLLYMAEFPVAVSHLSAAIHTARIPHHCRLPAGFNLTTSVPLQSDGTYRRVPHDAYPANTFVQCWTNVEDVGQTLYKCCTNVLCLLGIYSYSGAIIHKKHYPKSIHLQYIAFNMFKRGCIFFVAAANEC